MADDLAAHDIDMSDFIELGRVPKISQYLRDLWDRREFAFIVPYHDLRAQKINTLIGQFWHLLNPIMTFLVYYIIFGVIIDLTRGDIENFVGFLSIGVLVFTMMSRVMTDSLRAIENNAGLIRSVDFPRALLPISEANGQMMAFVPALFVLFGAMVFTGETPSFKWLLVFPGLVLCYLINVGVGLLMARAGFAVRDLQQIMQHVIRLLFYASGVIFVPSFFITNETVLSLFALNPYYDALAFMRWALMDIEMPTEAFVMLLVYSVLLPIVGLFVFMRAEHKYAGS